MDLGTRQNKLVLQRIASMSVTPGNRTLAVASARGMKAIAWDHGEVQVCFMVHFWSLQVLSAVVAWELGLAF